MVLIGVSPLASEGTDSKWGSWRRFFNRWWSMGGLMWSRLTLRSNIKKQVLKSICVTWGRTGNTHDGTTVVEPWLKGSPHPMLLSVLIYPSWHMWNPWHFHPSFSALLPHSLSLSKPLSTVLPHNLILMHGCIFGLCRDSRVPGGFSWNQFTLPVPSHWSTIYRPSSAGAAGRLFNRYIRCLTWQSIYSQ